MNSTPNPNYWDMAKASALIALMGIFASFLVFLMLGFAMWTAEDDLTRRTPAIVFAVGAFLSVIASMAMFARHVLTETGAKTILTQAEYRVKAATASKDEAYTASVMRMNGAQVRPAPQLPAHRPVRLLVNDQVVNADLFKTQAQQRRAQPVRDWMAPASESTIDAELDEDGLVRPNFIRVAQPTKIEMSVETVDEKRARILQLVVMIYSRCRMRNPSRAYVESKLGAAGASNALMKSAGDYTDAMSELERQGRAWRDRSSKTSPWLWVDPATGEPIDLR